MAVKHANNVSTTLSSGALATDTALSVASAAGMPSLGASDWCYATLSSGSSLEIVRVTGISGATLTVARGQDGTTAQAWSTGAALEMRLTAGGMADAATQSAVSAAPATPAAGDMTRYARTYGGRVMPAAIGPDGVEQVMQPLLARRSCAAFVPAWGSSTGSVIGLVALGVGSGTATAASYAATSVFTRARRVEVLNTTASTSAVASTRWGFHMLTRGSAATPGGGFHFVMRFGPATGVSNTSGRLFAGLLANSSAPTDSTLSALASCIGVGYDSGDTQLQIINNDASGTAVKTSLGAAFPRPTADRTSLYELSLFAVPGASWVGWEVTDLASGAVANGTLSSDIPAAAQMLIPHLWASVGGVSSVVGVALMGFYTESDL